MSAGNSFPRGTAEVRLEVLPQLPKGFVSRLPLSCPQGPSYMSITCPGHSTFPLCAVWLLPSSPWSGGGPCRSPGCWLGPCCALCTPLLTWRAKGLLAENHGRLVAPRDSREYEDDREAAPQSEGGPGRPWFYSGSWNCRPIQPWDDGAKPCGHR